VLELSRTDITRLLLSLGLTLGLTLVGVESRTEHSSH
jgi:hypothetical protein